MFKLLKFMSPNRAKTVAAVLLLLVTTVASLALPTIMSMIVDNGINAMDMRYILIASGVMLAVAVVGLVSRLGASKLLAKINADFAYSLRAAVFKKVNTLDFDKLSEFGTGALITRSTEDVWMLSEVQYMLITGVVTIPVLVIGGTVLALMKNVWLALIMFAFFPILLFVLYFIMRQVRPLWEESDKYIDIQNSIIRERLMGIRVIRAFNREEKEMGRANEATRIMARNIIKCNVKMNSLDPLASFLLNAATVLIVYVGALSMENPSAALTAGDIIAIIQYVSLVMSGIMTLSFSAAFLPRVKVNCKRINEILDSEGTPEATDLDEARFSGEIMFDNVSFSYKGAEVPAVDGVSFKIGAGSKVAFIGGTGSGKSTVVQLLMGFYKPTGGNILFDGLSTENMSGKRVRDNISCVLQKPSIFEGTLRSNLAVSRSDASDDELKDALKAARLLDFVEECDGGLDYKVQAGGTNLSGGQKQRLAIARSLLKDAPIYIFDDSFSALDFLTESKLKAELAKRIKHRTQIVVTQRVTSARSADKIFVLDKGKIIAYGVHSELIDSCPLYREIYLSQTGGEL